MKFDIYTSISNQVKPDADIIDNNVKKRFENLGIKVNLKRFKGGAYPSKAKVIGEPDVLIAYFNTWGEKVGKGSVDEIEYAIHTLKVPVFLANKTNIFKFEGIKDENPKDWRHYAHVQGGYPLSTSDLRKELEGESDNEESSNRRKLL